MFGFGDTIEEIAKQVLLDSEDAVLIFNQGYHIIFANEAAEKLFGYSQREIVGLGLNEFIPERFHMQHDVFADEFSKEDIRAKYMAERTRKIYARHADGTEFSVGVTIMRPRVSKPAFVAIVRDQRSVIDDEKELLRIAATDPLTGAMNKEEFLTISEKEALRSKRYSRPFTVGLLSLDDLSTINEEYGYSTGDRALQWLTNICCNTLRNVDIFSRWSETEFGILLPETSLEGAGIISRRLIRLVADDSFEWLDQEIKSTLSIGITEYDDRKTSLEEAMRSAGEALAGAKDRGGDRVMSYEEGKLF